ncbi:VWA-like domain-containing protein [uncultured Piscinibacter sp.]|uniref:vWA domain-containing protein n=1 Tax=uncultured Piscinibacter sp. TaxID=1131835 RepID=UPI00260D7B85|nr:VWA-like domain-containing protein [uncultured Piscinibacter sp.]
MTEPAASAAAEAARRLAVARTRLILGHPFLGALALRLPLKPAGAWCATTATDARTLYYNPAWVAALGPAQLQFALAHEALHCALGHFARRGHRVRRRWDLACDFAINPLLLDEGLQPPAGAQVLDLYRGMSAEEIYPCLSDEQVAQDTLDDHAWDEPSQDGSQGGGEGPERPPPPDGGGAPPQDSAAPTDLATNRPQPLSAGEREQLRQQWQRHMAAAAQRAREVGKLGGALARLVETGLAPRVSWRAALAHHLMQTAREDYSWLRPSRREGEALLPSLRSASGHVVVALDISGSVGDDELAQFVGEINALKGTLSVRTTLLACDSALAEGGPWVAEPWEPLELPRQLRGGGGTDFRPVFDWLARSGQRPDALVYFTDGEGEFPSHPPDYPVMWLVKGRAPVPWGRRIPLN